MQSYSPRSKRLGILGGGQLGRMLLPECRKFDVHTSVLDPSLSAPCATVADRFVQGDFDDFETVYQFGQTVDILTIEIEHVNVEALEKLCEEGKEIYPSPEVIRCIRDKSLQNEKYLALGIPSPGFIKFNSLGELREQKLKFPCVYKSGMGGYDGKGVVILEKESDLNDLPDVAGIIEEFVGEMKEIGVVVARGKDGQMAVFPPVEMEFHPTANLVEYISCPAEISPEVLKKINLIAQKTAEGLGVVGLLAVEIFLTPKGEVLVNESAPRPHNSGHLTIENNYTSQYEQHLRAILGLPLGSTRLKKPAIMLNLLGEPGFSGSPIYQGLPECLALEGVSIHLYGKAETRPFRKMGHVTLIGEHLSEIREKAIFVRNNLKIIA